MTFIPATITAEVLEHADGRPVAYIDATGVAVFACQQPDGTYVIDICTRDDTADGRLRLLLDGQPLPVPRRRTSPLAPRRFWQRPGMPGPPHHRARRRW